jgi:hypothetical protein
VTTTNNNDIGDEQADTRPGATETETDRDENTDQEGDPFQGISTTNALEAAIQYARAGLTIFPIAPNSKQPATEHGFKDATCNLKPLDHNGWSDFIAPDGSELTVTPHENWATEPGRAGFTVIDIDPKNGGDATWNALIAKHGPLVTREVSTPGSGRHLWCRGTIVARNKKLGPGIDTRCFGGYALLPPGSIVSKGLYNWINPSVPIAPLPDWAREILEHQTPNTSASAPRSREHDNLTVSFSCSSAAAVAADSRGIWAAL